MLPYINVRKLRLRDLVEKGLTNAAFEGLADLTGTSADECMQALDKAVQTTKG